MARVWLRITGVPSPDEALADVAEEAESLRRDGASGMWLRVWATWEIFLIGAFAVRDRQSGVPDHSSSSRKAQPAMGSLQVGRAFRLALRRFRREPGSALTAALTLALGFGASAAIYATLEGFGRPIPVPDGERIVQIRFASPDGSHPDVAQSLVTTWRPDANLEALGAFHVQSVALSGMTGGAVRVSSAAMTPAAYGVLGVSPVVGRLPEESDVAVVLIAEGLWRVRYDAATDVVGRTLRVDGVPHVIIGVMPESFAFPFHERAWRVLHRHDLGGSQLFGKLAAGRTTNQAAESLQGGARALLMGTGDGMEVRAHVAGFTENRGEGGEEAALRIVLIIVNALLLVSCANVSNILIVRAAARSHAMALHAALGATPRQVVLQMMAEALTIAGAGALLGLGVAWGVVTFIETTLAEHWGYYWMRVALEPEALVFLLVLALVTALVAGTVPARRAGRADPMSVLKRGGPGAAAGRPGWVAQLMLGGQVAFSFVALAASLLIAGGLFYGQEVHPDFPAGSILTSSVSLDGAAYDERASRSDFRRRLAAGVSSDPVVAAAALSTGLPGLNAPAGHLELEGAAADPDAIRPVAFTHAVSAGYFEMMNLDVLAGRMFDVLDREDDPIAVVSEAFAGRHFQDDDPIGRRLRVSGVTDDWHRIVGVVQDPVIYTSARGFQRERVYFPIEQIDPGTFFVSASIRGDPDVARSVIGRAVSQLDADLPVSSTFIPSESGTVVLTEVLAYVRRVVQSGGTLAVLGGIGALLVAAIGLYGVLAFDVQRRVREIGVRKAIGAGNQRMLREVMGWGLRNIIPGLTVGIVIAWFGMPLFGVFLSDADPRNPRVYLALVAGFLTVMALATVIPAWRASRLDPVAVLKED
jgi:predicted permease